ncbi:MAG: Ppx/GppA family phosphatase [Prevotella sp.]|jgi:exopolyphosphatase/guanosine-5'-triphosphate,3'-diphosphate pyrophosphatase|uniref:Ppx/GppA family phosphatase n=1 Tax=Segatella cerevisiae TaxID=2053716 RepID=A0ABT1C085_9BACT|nr:Ppx/GppA family phosphatase [Segatella cerevisiae]MCH3995263.1 Ppx/GppA family phosphatase [Prevotella sp.]MCI1246559.1 Ppx/GppA family phosphatase [Prevotella sp.]MCO6026375.1 Ppx/GppA family phosphatase [Segatella cerevisiae]
MKKTVFNLAAIDIGSNGARLLIKRFDENAQNEEDPGDKIMFIRVPLRLGKDVFTLGRISKEREYMMIHMLKGFKEFMKLNDVRAYRACATSAMRDAENGKKVLRKIRKKAGIRLEIIPGAEEAHLLCNDLMEVAALRSSGQLNEDDASESGNFVYMDVGGGSTEVSLIHDGALVDSHSFNIGTLRLLGGKVTKEEKSNFETKLKGFADKFPDLCILGSGGNINKLYKLIKPKKDHYELPVSDLKQMYNTLKPMSIEERIHTFHLKDDRADVIVPAASIFLKASECLKAESILVPNISLADSIVDGLYRNYSKQQ